MNFERLHDNILEFAYLSTWPSIEDVSITYHVQILCMKEIQSDSILQTRNKGFNVESMQIHHSYLVSITEKNVRGALFHTLTSKPVVLQIETG